jgi:signal transduction histidine kinase
VATAVDRLARLPLGWDIAVAVVAVGSLLAITPQIEPSGTERSLDAIGYLAVVAAGSALGARRRWPTSTVITVTAALTVYLWRGYAGGPVYVTLFIALYSMARWVDRRAALVVAAAASGWLVVVGLVAHTGPGLVHLVFVGWAAAAVFLGDGVRSHQAYLAGLEDRAAALGRSREEESRRRVTEERLRIARDLHDTVAHSMSAVNVQAGVAAHLVAPGDERTRASLETIKETSRVALEEMHALLGLLRVDETEGAGAAGRRSPTPDLRQLTELVASTEGADVDVDLTVDGSLDDIPAARSVAAYRITQESLTNVIRHAGPHATVRVDVAAAEGSLAVTVVDDGGGGAVPSPPGSGVGLTGMRERAEATGGHLEAGPRTGGGYRVHVAWPGER